MKFTFSVSGAGMAKIGAMIGAALTSDMQQEACFRILREFAQNAEFESGN